MFDERINTIFLDMDGVLADFDKRALQILGMPAHEYEKTFGTDWFWLQLKMDPDFFRNLDLMPDALDLFNAVRHLPHAILTGIPKGVDSFSNQKVDWAADIFGPELKVFCTQASKKWTFCQAGDILIDDRYRYAKKWEGAGGIFIKHYSAEVSIQNLKALGVI
jgi:5'(3')-deoxyribonucleotidase